jgi:hypothetical protein
MQTRERAIRAHPRLAGIQLSIEPMPTGNLDFLTLLEELCEKMPPGKILSVAAYPPPTRWHPHASVHWDVSYFRQVARRVDLIVPMMYDTSVLLSKIYQRLIARWTSELLNRSGATQVLLGVPDRKGDGHTQRAQREPHSQLFESPFSNSLT